MAEPEILLETRGRLGLVTLNRPQALNALNLDMVRLLDPQLRAWAADPAIAAVAIRGAGGARLLRRRRYPRALRSRPRRPQGRRRSPSGARNIALNALIKNYPKPYVALIEGIVMGGGVGLSVHGSHRIGAEKITFAMPEVGIGFSPMSARLISCRG